MIPFCDCSISLYTAARRGRGIIIDKHIFRPPPPLSISIVVGRLGAGLVVVAIVVFVVVVDVVSVQYSTIGVCSVCFCARVVVVGCWRVHSRLQIAAACL